MGVHEGEQVLCQTVLHNLPDMVPARIDFKSTKVVVSPSFSVLTRTQLGAFLSCWAQTTEDAMSAQSGKRGMDFMDRKLTARSG